MHVSICRRLGIFALLLSSLPVGAEDFYTSKVFTDPKEFTSGIEGPSVGADGSLYAVNFEKKSTIGIVTPEGRGRIFVTLPNGSVGNGIRFDSGESMLIADYVNHNVLKVDMATKEISVLVHEPKMNQPNDLAIGSNDILYCSDPNWGQSTGQLWRVTPDGKATLLDGELGTTNGLEVSPDEKKLYVNESVQRNVWSYDLSSSGEISNKRLLIKFPDFGMDGMRCDVDGNLHITRYGKGTIAIVSPGGEVLREVAVKGKNPSNVCFGGPDGRTCYVTVADKGNIEVYRSKVPGRSWKLREERKKTRSGSLTFVRHVLDEGFHALGADIGDRDAKGMADVLACSGGLVYLYSGKKRYTVYESKSPALCIHLRTADIDKDGDMDAIVADHSNGVFYLENPGKDVARKQVWKQRFVDSQCIGAHAVALGDINRDGRIDVVASGESNSTPPDSIYWFECPARPNEADEWPKVVLGPGQSGGLAHYPDVGDVNGDGRLDVVHAAKAEKTGEWYRLWTQPEDATGAWKFSEVGKGYKQATNVQLGDIDGDGIVDILASQGHDVGVHWFEGPDWKVHTIDKEMHSPHTLVLVDLDADGDLDGATCAYESKLLVWFENDGKGRFKTHIISTSQQAYDLVARDVDNDGDLDLLVAGQRSDNVVWYEQVGRPDQGR